MQREAIGATDDNEIQLDKLLTTVEVEASQMDKAAQLEKAENELKELRAKNKALASENEDQACARTGALCFDCTLPLCRRCCRWSC